MRDRFLLLVLTVGLSLAADALALPAPALFGALLAGLAVAIGRPEARLDVPAPAFGAAQAVVGVALGLLLKGSTLTAVGADWAPVLGVSAATLALTVAAGVALARFAPVDRPTAALGMIAGGASGIVAMSGELGADDRLVALMQYLRVLVIVALTPIVVPVVFGVAAGPASAPASTSSPLLGLTVTTAASTGGVLLARRARLPAGTLLGPLLLAGLLSVTGVVGHVAVPAALQTAAFALIGLQVGLRFTPAAVRQAGRLVAPTLVAIVVLIAVSAGLGVALAALADVSVLDGYLATTPGGLYAVLAAAVGSGANTTFVLAVQILRLFVMLLAAPPLVRVLAARGAGSSARAPNGR